MSTNYLHIKKPVLGLMFFETYDDGSAFVLNDYEYDDEESCNRIALLNYNIYIKRLKYTKEYFITKVLLLQTEFEFLKKVGLL